MGQSQAFEGRAGGKSHTGKERLTLQCSHPAPPSPASSQGSVASVTDLKYAQSPTPASPLPRLVVFHPGRAKSPGSFDNTGAWDPPQRLWLVQHLYLRA